MSASKVSALDHFTVASFAYLWDPGGVHIQMGPCKGKALPYFMAPEATGGNTTTI